MTEKSPAQFECARGLLCALQDYIGEQLIEARNRISEKFARIAGVTAERRPQAILGRHSRIFK